MSLGGICFIEGAAPQPAKWFVPFRFLLQNVRDAADYTNIAYFLNIDLTHSDK